MIIEKKVINPANPLAKIIFLSPRDTPIKVQITELQKQTKVILISMHSLFLYRIALYMLSKDVKKLKTFKRPAKYPIFSAVRRTNKKAKTKELKIKYSERIFDEDSLVD